MIELLRDRLSKEDSLRRIARIIECNVSTLTRFVNKETESLSTPLVERLMKHYGIRVVASHNAPAKGQS